MEDWLSIGQLQEQTGIPDRSLRRYLTRYGEYLTLKTRNRSYLVDPTMVPVLRDIRDWYSKGRSHDEILALVQETCLSMAVTGLDDTSCEVPLPSPKNVGSGLTGPAEVPAELWQAIDGLRDQLEITRSQLESEAYARTAAEETRDRYILKRDEQLIATMRHLLNERKKPWWQRRRTTVV